ncbi:hypothetical protein BVX99_03175 [bacterium F16]|nr:hypothetical protein BVX99_03175 [bacterium F16]
MKQCFILLFGLLPISLLFADSIELWNGSVLDRVEVLGAKDGMLRYKTAGKIQGVALTEIRSIDRESSHCKIIRFVDYTHKKKAVKLLTVRVDEPDKDRIRRPLVRIFSCEKNNSGVYEITLNKNSRIDDPTHSSELEIVDAADFLNRHYLLSKTTGLAYRVEIWRDGVLQSHKNYGNDSGLLPADWYRSIKIRTTRTMRPASDVVIEDPNEKLENEKEEPKEKGWAIDSVSVLPEVLESVPRLKVDYSMLNPLENSTVTPKVICFYVTQNEAGDKEISSVTVAAGSGKPVALTEGRYKGSVTKKLPAKLRLTKFEAMKEPGLVQLIHWRVELIRGETVLAAKDKPGNVTSQLPDNWWK